MVLFTDLRKKKIRNELLIVAGYGLVAFFLILPYLLSNTFFYGPDGISFFASKSFYAKSLLSGDYAFWNKYLLGGMPSEIQGTITYPTLIVFGFLSFKAAAIFVYWFQLVIGSYFLYKYLSQVKCNSQVAVVVAILYECSIHIGGCRKDHIGIIICITLLPMIMYFAQKYLDDGKFRWLALCAFGMSLQVGVNVYQQAIYTDILVFFYLVIIAMQNRVKLKKLIVDIFSWGFTYIGMSAFVLIPTFFVMSQFSEGDSGTSFEFFKSFSIAFYKFLQMIFPRVYGDIYSWPSANESSGMDIELFVGVFCFAILLFSILRYRKEKMIRISFTIMIVAVLYSAIGHIPFLRQIVYRIPIIGGFRVPARALYIFLFFVFVIIAVGLTKMLEKNELLVFSKRYLAGVIVTIGLVAAFVGMSSLYIMDTEKYSIQELMKYSLDAFVPSIIVAITTLVIMFVIVLCFKNDKYKKYAFLGLITIVTIFEVFPYESENNDLGQAYFDVDEQVEYIVDNLGDSRTLDARVGYFSNVNSFVAENMSVERRIPSINAYVAFNYPNLHRIINAGETCSFNSTGAMVGSSHMENLLHYENGILSMLGVRYIFDSSGLLTEDNSFHIETGEEFNVLEVYDIEVDFSEEQSIGIWGTPIDIEANSTYTIDLVVESSSEEGSIVIDFYGGSTYDSNEQQAMVIVEQGENHFRFRLSSGDTSLSEGEPQIRVFCCDGSLDRIVSLSVNKIEAVTIEYPLVSTEEGTAPIYENPEVNSILYTPSAVEHVDSFSDMFNSLIDYDFKDTAYVEEDLNMFINQSDITFSDVNFTNNQIVAEVSAQSDGFVMFSQSYFPGWRAYIDGEEVELYCVSGTIMGAKVPEGDHEIKFTYIPTYTILGGIVTVGTYVALILGGIVVRRKRITENKTI